LEAAGTDVGRGGANRSIPNVKYRGYTEAREGLWRRKLGGKRALAVVSKLAGIGEGDGEIHRGKCKFSMGKEGGDKSE